MRAIVVESDGRTRQSGCSQSLRGITVVSLEHAVAAPFATRQPADLGARVVKIERPGVEGFGVTIGPSTANRAAPSVFDPMTGELTQEVSTGPVTTLRVAAGPSRPNHGGPVPRLISCYFGVDHAGDVALRRDPYLTRTASTPSA